MKTKTNITKIIRISLSICLTAFCIFYLCSCSFSEGYDKFDENTEGIVDVKTVTSSYDEQKDKYIDTYFYYSFASQERIKEIEPFTGDKLKRYYVNRDCFYEYYDKRTDKYINRIANIAVMDKNENEVKITPEIKSIFKAIEKLKIEHNILYIEIIKDGKDYFVYYELNVNWWLPCNLYYFDKENTKLIKIYTLDREKVSAIRIRNLSLLNDSKAN